MFLRSQYEVLDSNNGISLLEVQPHTGFKHQIRAHLAYGLNTPIIGEFPSSDFHGNRLVKNAGIAVDDDLIYLHRLKRL